MSTVQRCEQFIAGRFVPSVSGEYFPLFNPENEEISAEIANSTPQDVDHAVEAAQHAFKHACWRSHPEVRIAALRTLAAKLRQHMPALVEAESRVTGRPIREMRAQLGRLPEWYDYSPAWPRPWKIRSRLLDAGI